METKTYEDGAAEIDYIDLLSIPEGKSGDFAITHTEEPTGFPNAISPVRAALLGNQPTGFVKYDHPTTWIKLTEGDTGVWMTDSVCEQEQHWRALRDLHGTILVGGLGIGMAVKILEENLAVSKVLVVEKSQDVIDLVWPHVKNDKSEIICQDIHGFVRHYLRSPYGSRPYEFAFIDTWASDGEQTFFDHVIPIREAIYRNGIAKRTLCWNEDVMRGQLQMGLISRWIHAAGLIDRNEDAGLLSDLCDVNHESIWRRWSAPFFLAIDERDIWDRFEDYGAPLALMYSRMVGMPGWEELWPIVSDQMVPPRGES